ncbi:MAG: phage portal protein, partial [Bacteroidaceae bacterium]|nr:phage portal protein [Bacteroidaceae bacterium]
MPNIISRLANLFGPAAVHVSIAPEERPTVDGLTARQLYATQANLNAVVSFIADSVAQLPLKVYIRDGESERRRDRDSIAARLLWRPNADQTSYEFWEATAKEYALMGVCTWWLLPDPDSESGYQLRIIPNEWILNTKARTNYAPDSLRIMTGTGGNYIDIPRTDYIQFRKYAPGNPGGYQTPIAALRQTLMEQIEADRFRAKIWRTSGRFNAYLTRPANVQQWDDQTRKRFLETFREGWGANGENAGKMPLLEDGMEIKPYQFNAQQAQYAETKQLSREDVAAAYHINPSLIWHTSTQTYASAKDNARALYSECLGPMLQMFQQRINSFLLPMVGAD